MILTRQTKRSSGSHRPDLPSQHAEVRRWPPRPLLTDGGLEALKWLALILMTADHVNKYLLAGTIKPMFYTGRLAMPIFAFVLAYNLARAAARRNGVFQRVSARLALIGALSCVPYIALGIGGGGVHWGWWPLNILATLLVATVVIWLLDRDDRALAALAFVTGGAVVEFWWPGVACCVCAWMYCRRPNWTTWLAFVAAAASLSVINGNLWSLATVPVIYIVGAARIELPRLRWTFYAYYPAHLAVLWALSAAATSPVPGGLT